MNAPVTRRALLGATAAVGAVGLPTVVPALANPAELDVELFTLLDAWAPARAAADAAGERSEALWDVFVDMEPKHPVALHYSGADGLGCGFDVEIMPNGRHVALYGLQDVEKLRAMPISQVTATRRAEVIAAHDAWMVERQAVKDRLGIDAVDEAEEEAAAALHEVETAILDTVPATAAGLVAKARWATRPGLPKGWADIWAQRIAADVVAMAERVGAAS